jgi:hypothetical protein
MSKADSVSFEVREPSYEDPYIRTVLSTIPYLPDFHSADDITLSLTWVEQLQWNDTFNTNDNDIDALQPPFEPHLNDVGTILSLPITLPSPSPASAPQIDVLNGVQLPHLYSDNYDVPHQSFDPTDHNSDHDHRLSSHFSSIKSTGTESVEHQSRPSRKLVRPTKRRTRKNKKPIVVGPNRWGRMGTIICVQCRKHRQKVSLRLRGANLSAYLLRQRRFVNDAGVVDYHVAPKSGKPNSPTEINFALCHPPSPVFIFRHTTTA